MLKDVIAQAVKTRGDFAVVLLAGTVGFVMDAGADILNFLDPVMTGTIFTTSALGIKMAWEELTKRSRGKKSVYEKADAITKLIKDGDNPDKSKIIETINKGKQLYELRIISLDNFDNTLIEIVDTILKK